MNLTLFGIGSSKDFAQKVAEYLSIPLSSTYEYDFSDGEAYLRPDTNIRTKDVFVISSLYSDSNKTAGAKLWELIEFCGACRDASAGRVTAVCPYLAFSRQDRKTVSRAPITTKYVAECLEAVGVSRVITVDIHNLAAFQNAFRIPTDNLEAKNILAEHISKLMTKKDYIILSPDAGGTARSRAFRLTLEKITQKKLGLAYLDKYRQSDKEVLTHDIVGNVSGKSIIIVDDMISSGSTMKKCIDTVKEYGGQVETIATTHGLMIGDALNNLQDSIHLIMTDTVEPRKNVNAHKVSTTSLLAQAIRRNHDGDSVSSLFSDST